MCIAIYKPYNATIDKDILETCWDNNDDGGGYMFPWQGQIIIRKGFFSFDSFYAMYLLDLEDNPKAPFVLHFRIATSGNIDKRNTHPHRVNSNLALVHNGVLDVCVPKKSRISDTILFSKMLAGLPNGWQKNTAMTFFIEKFLGKSNKVVLMNNKGKVTILNESAGYWEEGVWYSNYSFRWPRYYSSSCYGGWQPTSKTKSPDTFVSTAGAFVMGEDGKYTRLSLNEVKKDTPTDIHRISKKIDLIYGYNGVDTEGRIYGTSGCLIPVPANSVPQKDLDLDKTSKVVYTYRALAYADPMFNSVFDDPTINTGDDPVIHTFFQDEISRHGEYCPHCNSMVPYHQYDEDEDSCLNCFIDNGYGT